MTKGNTAGQLKDDASLIAGTIGSQLWEGSDVLVKPKEDPFFIVPEQTKAFLRAIEKISRDVGQTNVCVRGPQGGGKTGTSEWFANKTGRPLFVQDIPTLREPKDLFGYKDIVAGEHGTTLAWKKSGFVEAITTPRCCVVLDELTRVHPSVCNTMLPLLDHRREVWIDEIGERIKVAPGVVFFATANVGMQFTGTWQMDLALQDRFSYLLDVSYLPPEQEATVLVNKTGVDASVAKRFTEVAAIIRQKVKDSDEPLSHEISTRQLIAACFLVTKGVQPIDAMEFTVIPTYSDEGGTSSERAQVLTIMQGKLPAV